MNEISMLIRSELRAENRVKCIDLLQMKVNHRDALKILAELPVKGDNENSSVPFEWDIRLKHNSTSNNSISVNIHHGDRLRPKMCAKMIRISNTQWTLMQVALHTNLNTV